MRESVPNDHPTLITFASCSSYFSQAIMSQTYEYPPSLKTYRSLQEDRPGAYTLALKLQHHFFITRAKIVFQEVLKVDNTVRVERYMQEEIVRYTYRTLLTNKMIHFAAEHSYQPRVVFRPWCSVSDPAVSSRVHPAPDIGMRGVGSECLAYPLIVRYHSSSA